MAKPSRGHKSATKTAFIAQASLEACENQHILMR
jgi:hypothetical protein